SEPGKITQSTLARAYHRDGRTGPVCQHGGQMSKGKTITLWILSGLLAALFLFAGGFKLVKPEMAKAGFVQMGYAAWFAIFIGVCEVLGGIGVLIPRVAGLAAACLSVIMAGAVYTVVSHHLPGGGSRGHFPCVDFHLVHSFQQWACFADAPGFAGKITEVHMCRNIKTLFN